jgi:hypothetical protein
MSNTAQTWHGIYQELAAKVTTDIPAIKWADLWHNQVNFLAEELPFPSPSVFFAFRTREVEDRMEHIQQADFQVDVYFFYETYTDTFSGAINQGSAMDYLKLMDEIHTTLHATSGENYSNMRFLSLSPVDTGTQANVYRISFECVMLF